MDSTQLQPTLDNSAPVESTFNIPYHTHNGIDSPLLDSTSSSLSKVRVHLAANTTAVGAQQIPFDTIDFDTGNNFSTASHQFTAKVAGYYQAYATAYFSGGTINQQYAMKIYKNNVEISESNKIMVNASDNPFTIGVSDIVSLAVGDHLDFYSYTNALSSVNINQGTTITYATINQLS